MYVALEQNPGFGIFVVKLLTFWVAYSHVMLEVVKLGQTYLIGKDVTIFDKEAGFTVCRNSDLIEELG